MPARLIALLAMALASGSIAAQALPPIAIPPGTTVQLATIAPGEVYWQRFGHNTLIVSPASGENDATSYNFGYFDFEQPDFFTRFLRGRMLYQALALPATDDLGGYIQEQRSVHLQSLALSPVQAERLADLLRNAVRPENRDYLYEYFRANCSTRIRDAIDSALDGELKRQTIGRSRGYTYRMHAARLAQGDFWLATGIDLGLGPDTDRALTFWDEMFIPDLLRRHLREVTNIDGDPLVADENAWFDSGRPPPPELADDRTLPFATVGIVIALGLLWLGRRTRHRNGARRALAWIAATLHLLFGLAGAILLFLWLGTDHIAAHRNENLLLLSPLSLLLVPFWLRRAGHQVPASANRIGDPIAIIIALCAAVALIGKTVPAVFIQSNLHWCLLLLPIHLALSYAWRTVNMSLESAR